MNVYDSERMTAALAAQGYEATGTAEDADLILLNTCHIREKAAEKVYSELGRLKPLKRLNPEPSGWGSSIPRPSRSRRRRRVCGVVRAEADAQAKGEVVR